MATNRHYVITVGTAADLSGLEKDLDKALKKPRTIKVNAKDTEVKNTTKGVKDLNNALKDQDNAMQNNLLTFQAANMILSKTIDIMSSIVEQVYELNGAVTEYRKVTDLSGDSLDKYVGKLSEMGREVARTGSEMVEAATEFRKNSFSDEDSASLALVSTMYQNIADEAISAGDSASFLIAMMKAFNVEAKDATSIIDATNEVANNFAVSSADIATALPKVSATLAQAGNSMSESMGLLVGATELMPGNASRVARGLRTITLGLQGLDDEGEESFELVSKLQDQFDKLGISLVDGNGQLRSSYDILYDLNGQWGSLDKNTKLYIAEIIAGKNQVDVFNALMSNFNSVISANETAMNSAGSAAKENAAYMESLEAKVSALKQAFQELSTSMIDDDVAGLALDIAKSFLELANTDAGRILMIGTAVTALTIASKGLFDAIKVGLLGSLGALSPALIGVLVAVTALVAFAPQIMDFFDSVQNPIENSTKKLEANAVQLEENRKRLKELESIPWYDRTPEIQAEIDSLRKLNEELEESNKKYEQKQIQAAKDALERPYQQSVITYEADIDGTLRQFETLEGAIRAVNAAYEENFTSVEQLTKAGYYLDEVLNLVSVSGREMAKDSLQAFNQIAIDLQVHGELAEREYQDYIRLKKALEEYYDNLVIAGEGNTELAIRIQASIANMNGLISATKEHDKVLRIVAQGIEITKEQAEELIATNAVLKDSIVELNGKHYLEEKTLYDLAIAGNKFARQRIDDEVATTTTAIEETKKRLKALQEEQTALNSFRSKIQTQWEQGLIGDGTYYALRGGAYLSADASALEADLAGSLAYLETLKGVKGQYKTSNPLGKGSSDTKKATKKATEDVLKTIKDLIAIYEHDIFVLTQKDAEGNAEKIIAIYKKMQETVHKQRVELTKKGYADTSEEVMELQKLWWKYENEIQNVYDSIEEAAKKALEEIRKKTEETLNKTIDKYKELAEAAQKESDFFEGQASAYETYAKMMIDYLDEQIEGYQAEIDALEKANDEREKEIALQEKINNLAKAKDSTVMVYKDGRFQRVTDIDKVSAAQGELTEYQRQRQLEKEKEYWQDKIDELNKYKDEWSNFTKDYEKEANMQILIQSGLFNQEDLLFKNRLNSANKFALDYEAAMKKAQQALQEMLEYEKKIEDIGKTQSIVSGGAVGDGTDWSGVWADAHSKYLDGTYSKAEADAIKDYAHNMKSAEMAGSGSVFNPASGTWSGGSSSSGSSTGSGSSSSSSSSPNINKVVGGVVSGIVGLITGGKKYADGTLSASGGISLVGENGPELRVLGNGDGIIPADITRNVWAMGENPYAFMSNASKLMGGANSSPTIYQFDIDGLQLPSVSDAPSFVDGLKRYAHQYSAQRS